MPMTRRDAIRASMAAGAAAATPAVLASLAPSRDSEETQDTQADDGAPKYFAQAIRRRRIPKSGELLPMIGLGTSGTFNVDPETELEPLVPVMQGFLDAGGSVIDSSPMYRRAESVVGALLDRINRRDVFFATKVWTDGGREAGIAQMNESFRKMGAGETMDLMQVHNLVDWRTHLPTLRQWKAEGMVRYIGITEMRDWETVEVIMRDEDIDFIQIPYSLREREVEARILPAAADLGVAVLVMRPFMRGRLFRAVRGRDLPLWAAEFDCASWAQFFLKFILGHPAVTCPIPATSDLKHLIDNMQAGTGRLPDQRTRERMIAFMES